MEEKEGVNFPSKGLENDYNHLLPIPTQKQNIEQAINEWQASSQDGQIDDMLMIGVKV